MTTSSTEKITDEAIDFDGFCHGGHNHDVFYNASSGDDEFYDLMQSTWATGEADNSFCDANSDCTRLTGAFYDTNSDRAPMEDFLFSNASRHDGALMVTRELISFSFNRLDDWSIGKTHHCIQPYYADRGEPALSFPASTQSNVDEEELLFISCSGDQSHANLPESDTGESESTLPPTTVDDPTGERNRETPLCSNGGMFGAYSLWNS
jgi:hypothetical protein